MQLLNKQSFAVNHFASKEESRYTLKGILVTRNETVATDGHVLARVSHPKFTDDGGAKNFPSVPGFTPNGTPDKFILPLDTATAIAKSIPRKTTIPILGYAAFSASGETGEGQVAVTDLDRPQVFGVKAISGQFPNWKAVIPTYSEHNEKWTEAVVNVQLLKRIVQGLEEFTKGKSVPSVRIKIRDGKSPIRMDAKNDEGQNMTVVVMPFRGDGYEELDKEVKSALANKE